MKVIALLLFVLTFNSLMSTQATAKSAQAKAEKVTSVEGITEYRYPNGLRVLLFPDHSKPTVTVNITYLVGSRLEGRGESGMAHLLEHMLFKGTPTHKEIWKLLQEHGAQFNGTTWLDRTNYYETLPSQEEGNLEFALKLEADRMLNSLVAKEDLDKEMTVVRNEFEMGENNPISVLSERMMSAAYLWHNYGKSTIGSRSDIERVPIENLQAFYKKYYRPDNSMLVVAGDFKEEKALELIQKYFAPLTNPATPIESTYTLEPVQDGPRHVELRRVGDVPATGAIYHICAGSHPDFAGVHLLEQIMTDRPNGRLYKNLVEAGLAASVSGMAFPLREPGMIQFMATVGSDKNPQPALEKMKETLENIAKNPITDEETTRAKNRLLKEIELQLKDSSEIGIALTEAAAAGDWRLFFLHRDRLEKVTAADVNRIATLYFKESNRTTGVFVPTKEPERTAIPETPDVMSLVREYKGKGEIAKGESIEPKPEKIEERVKRSQLSNGVKLALLSKKTRGEAVHAALAFHYGSYEDFKARGTQPFSMIPQLLTRGTKKHSYQQIRDEFDRLKASVRFGGGGSFGSQVGTLSASIETDRSHLNEVIDLVAEILEQPTFPEEEFEIVRKETIASMEQQQTDPQALGFLSIFRRLNPWGSDDPRYVPTIQESIARIKAVKIEEIRKAHADFLGASHAEISVVGDFDESAIKQSLEKAFASWNSPKPFRRMEMPLVSLAKPGNEVIQTPDKQMAIVGAALNFEMKDDDPNYAAMQLANFIFGASADSKLMNRLRQKEGLSYGAFSMFNAQSLDKNAFFASGAICAPQNAEKAMNSMLDEIRLFTEQALDNDALEDAKDSYALQVQNKFSEDQNIAAILNGGLYLGRTLEFHKNLYEKISKLKASDIQNAVKSYVQKDRLFTVKAGDLKGSPQ